MHISIVKPALSVVASLLSLSSPLVGQDVAKYKAGEALRCSTAGDCMTEAVKETFKGDNHARVRIIIGYDDVSPGDGVSNEVDSMIIKRALEKAGFRGGFWGGGKGANWTLTAKGDLGKITVECVSAAYSDSHAKNVANAGAQAAKSQAAKAKYQSSMGDGTDVVIYVGHSRSGKAFPGVFLPPLTANGHVAYNSFPADQRFETTVAPYLRSSSDAPEVIACFSCSSSNHYASAFKAAYPASSGPAAFLGSTRVLYGPNEISEGAAQLAIAIKNAGKESPWAALSRAGLGQGPMRATRMGGR